MFTNADDIKLRVQYEGLPVDSISYINKGVMTDKYQILSQGKTYIVRCYPQDRDWLAEVEFKYLNLFQDAKVLAPKPILRNSKQQAFLVYEKLEGYTVSEVFKILNATERVVLCEEILENYARISDIQNYSCGTISSFQKFSNVTWYDFLTKCIMTAQTISIEKGDDMLRDCCRGMLRQLHSISERCDLVWSDFSAENIIVGTDKHLAGFIDFEGLMSGDSQLGFAYLLAHDQSIFADTIIRTLKHHNRYKPDIIKFYAVIRYLRLYPYAELNMPNGNIREPLSDFLPYSYKHLKDYIQ